MKRIFLDHWFLKLLSLSLATMMWVYVAGDETTSSVRLEALLEVRNLPSKQLVNPGTTRVSVLLRGPATLIHDLSNQTLFATVDASHLSPGDNMVLIGPDNVSHPFGVDVVDVAPQRVRITIGFPFPEE